MPKRPQEPPKTAFLSLLFEVKTRTIKSLDYEEQIITNIRINYFSKLVVKLKILKTIKCFCFLYLNVTIFTVNVSEKK